MATDRKTLRKRGSGPDKKHVAHAEPGDDRAHDVALGPRARSLDAPEPVGERHGPRVDTTDLMALAEMDPSEVAAAMGERIVQRRYRAGEEVTGRITSISRGHALVDLGGKSEGILALAELDGEGVGDPVTAWVLAAGEAGVQLSRRLSGRAAEQFLTEAAETGVPVEGRVQGRNPGGFDIQIGTVRAFCPVSQIDRTPGADLDSYLGQTLTFQVMEAGDDVVVSRRILQDSVLEETREAFWATAKDGDAHVGVVTSVKPWGAFVDIDGVEGLVHRSELDWDDVEDATTRVHRGQTLEVHILEMDRVSRKLSLSAKDPDATPWDRIGQDFVVGGIYSGTVKGVERYGVFVQIAPGLQGLLHVSRREAGEVGLPKPGESIEVKLVGVDRDRRRLELAEPGWEGGEAFQLREGKEESAGNASLGTLADLLKGFKLD
ncbi:MAG: S1 RNA-binding domain-containing protein [Deltaproteobacteria bacterium]|nr:S1 RNA-binding domain-containing protein [Deltaproteobacteria bacterium]